ncbi:MAG: VCBS repeat-containing protein [Rhodobacterales bacterium]|nr:VCBS repeat-containing protein [Rhodobacterales bacterium]
MLRAGLAAIAFWIASAVFAMATPPNVILEAKLIEPTTRYDHGVLGDAIEWGALALHVDMGCQGCETPATRNFVIRLPENRVFEDIEARIIDLGEGSRGVMVVETDLAKGARLALYDESGLIAATPFIGRKYRWLAPIGAADLDGDGNIEIAYIDRPHLAKTLRVWRYYDGELLPVVDLPDLTNHRIGEDVIFGGIRDCGDGFEVITANGNWSWVVATRFVDGALVARKIGDNKGPRSFKRALDCRAP